MSEQAVLVGGWTAYHKLTAKDQAVFDAALKGFVGGQYKPFEVSTQVVAGTNYRFKCKSTVPLPNPIYGGSRGADLPIVGWFSPYHLHHPYLIWLRGKSGRV